MPICEMCSHEAGCQDATVRLSTANVRGLAPVKPELKLLWGKIPQHLYYLSVSVFATDPEHEHYIAIVHNNGYRLAYPTQERTEASVLYECVDNRVMDIHSHANMTSFFSGIDNHDEQGLALYTVIGELHMLIPTSQIRVGVYGYYAPLEFSEVFDV